MAPKPEAEETLAAAGLDPPDPALRAVLLDNDVMRLGIEADGELVASVPLGPADAIGLASDLLLCARRRLGRPSLRLFETPKEQPA